MIYGQSLGTSVTDKLGSRLAGENVQPQGMVLTVPFSSTSSLIETRGGFGFRILISAAAAAICAGKN